MFTSSALRPSPALYHALPLSGRAQP